SPAGKKVTVGVPRAISFCNMGMKSKASAGTYISPGSQGQPGRVLLLITAPLCLTVVFISKSTISLFDFNVNPKEILLSLNCLSKYFLQWSELMQLPQ